jgi:hypothetical protein
MITYDELDDLVRREDMMKEEGGSLGSRFVLGGASTEEDRLVDRALQF